ncbi:hypothetical protein ACVILI_003874 [Mesorhizobium sp. USDA 4775]|uniref:hypothetical protein n=1 Tax=Mesorhizobium jarvisii TaxID=1777867 RepID=UPI0011DDC9FA|nr:hypothetical protein [Mesorhizobium jarvisii]MCH4558255.1 hypothetical protein [Mesorhizobium jarvisii]QGU20819.1 hypothetical protein MCHK_09980 [Mesorhizobium huakuii 7653R]
MRTIVRCAMLPLGKNVGEDLQKMKRLDFRNATVVVGAALGFPLLVGRPFFPAWFKPYALPLAFLIVIGMFGLVVIWNKVATGQALPGPKMSIKRSHIVVLVLIFVIPASNFLFHFIHG